MSRQPSRRAVNIQVKMDIQILMEPADIDPDSLVLFITLKGSLCSGGTEVRHRERPSEGHVVTAHFHLNALCYETHSSIMDEALILHNDPV